MGGKHGREKSTYSKDFDTFQKRVLFINEITRFSESFNLVFSRGKDFPKHFGYKIFFKLKASPFVPKKIWKVGNLVEVYAVLVQIYHIL
jgi:hypothetical protein